MSITKSLKDISWLVDEPTYRADEALSYSTLSTYEREGKFEKLPTLFEHKESPSLLWGSCLDTLLTDGEEAYNEQFFVAEFPPCSSSIINIVKSLFNLYKDTYNSLFDIPTSSIITETEIAKYQLNWKGETRAKKVREEGEDYYRLLYLAGDKQIISTKINNDVRVAADALRSSSATSLFFTPVSPFDGNIEILYQLKFKGEHEGVPYRCMLDACVVNHDEKWILPVDLKSSSKREYNFFKSFIEWGYFWQGKLYTDLLRQNILKDDYFKDFTIKPYIFVVVNNSGDNPIPLAWEFKESINTDDFICGKNKQFVFRSPYTIGKELWEYLHSHPSTPKGINIDKPNDLIEWLNTI